jgi:hypothetical protein
MAATTRWKELTIVGTSTKSEPSPKTITVYGRLSFPTWTAQEAYDRNLKGDYPSKDVASAKPDFQLLLHEAQWEKLHKHMTEVFLPYCAEQEAKGEKRDALTQAEVQQLIDGLNGDLSAQTFNTPVKGVSEKSAEFAPEAVATLKCIGTAGGDIELKAIVQDETELAVPDPDLLSFPVILPINKTTHQMYPGANVAATLNLYAYHNGRHPGFSAGVTTAVFKSDNERFGGSVGVDEDEMFLD